MDALAEARARKDVLRNTLQEIVAAATASKSLGRLDYEKWRAQAMRALLDYIGSGYVTRLMGELDDLRP